MTKQTHDLPVAIIGAGHSELGAHSFVLFVAAQY